VLLDQGGDLRHVRVSAGSVPGVIRAVVRLQIGLLSICKRVCALLSMPYCRLPRARAIDPLALIRVDRIRNVREARADKLLAKIIRVVLPVFCACRSPSREPRRTRGP
jgi:hypothetical protein